MGRGSRPPVRLGRQRRPVPTFKDSRPVAVEAFLLDFDGELYGEQIAVDFVEYLRPQATFADEDDLKARMAADCDRVRDILAGGHPSRPCNEAKK